MSGEEIMVKYLLPMQFEERDNLLAYFASKAEIEHNCPKPLDFFFSIQHNEGAEIPKITLETDSDHSEGEHEIYESDN